jgi:hypothetical protein
MAVTVGGNTIGKFNTYILESPQITGPWRLVAYMHNDGRTLWMGYSANLRNSDLHNHHKADPPASGYWWSLQEVKLLGAGSPKQH